MPDTGLVFPAIVENVGAFGLWANPASSKATDGALTSFSSSLGSDPTTLRARGYDFSAIPTGSTVTRIEAVRVSMSANGDSCVSTGRLFVDGVAADVCDEGANRAYPIGFGLEVVYTWTGAAIPPLEQIQDATLFGWQITDSVNTASARALAHDSMPMRISYTPPVRRGGIRSRGRVYGVRSRV